VARTHYTKREKGDSPLFPRIAKKGTVPFNDGVRSALALGAVALSAWMLCAPTFDYGFVYDDHAVVLDRAAAWEQGWSEFLSARAWGVARHATLLSLDLDRRDPPSPRPFRVTNAAIAAINSALVFLLAGALGLMPLGAFVAALIFALHPSHVDAMVSIVGRAELLAALGILTAMTLHARAYAGRVSLVISAGAMFFLAMASKESAACLIALIVCYELCRPAGRATFPASPDRRRPRLWPLAYVAAGSAWIALAAGKLGSVDPIVYADNPLAHVGTLPRVLGAGEVLWEYAAVTLWPFDLKPDRGYAEVTTSFGFGVAAWIAWTAIAIIVWRRRRSDPLTAFALAWLPAAFVVTGNVIVPIGTLMAERLLYLPSVGVCLLAGRATQAAWDGGRGRWRRVAMGIAFAGLLLALVASFQQRARVWADDDHYHQIAAALSPRSAKAHFNLGLSLARRERFEDAERSFGRALAIVPSFSAAAGYRSEALRRLGRETEALDVYRRYLDEDPDDVPALRIAAGLAEATDNRGEGLAYLRRAVELAPEDSELREALVGMEARARGAGQR
jgi:hypothetical protein